METVLGNRFVCILTGQTIPIKHLATHSLDFKPFSAGKDKRTLHPEWQYPDCHIWAQSIIRLNVCNGNLTKSAKVCLHPFQVM